MKVRVCVRVCVCKDIIKVCVSEREKEKILECWREREREGIGFIERERERVYVCGCIWERKREKESEIFHGLFAAHFMVVGCIASRSQRKTIHLMRLSGTHISRLTFNCEHGLTDWLWEEFTRDPTGVVKSNELRQRNVMATKYETIYYNIPIHHLFHSTTTVSARVGTNLIFLVWDGPSFLRQAWAKT